MYMNKCISNCYNLKTKHTITIKTINNKALLDYTSPVLCTPVTPFPADPIFIKRSSDGMIPCAA